MITAIVIAAARPTVPALSSASRSDQSRLAFTAVAMALAIAASSTVTPTATSQPKKQAPQLVPPYLSRGVTSTTCWLLGSGRSSSTGLPGVVVVVVGVSLSLGTASS